MPQLNTARGALDTADLGVTLMHEHVFIMTTEIAVNYPEAWGDERTRIAGAIERLDELKSRGVDTIVDLTVVGLGRYVPRNATIAAATELTGIKAAILKCATDEPGLTDGVERVLRAVAQAHRQTGVPISTHTQPPPAAGSTSNASSARRALTCRGSSSVTAATPPTWPTSRNSCWHYLHIHNDVLPALRRYGVTEEQITTMLVDNPRRIFERRGGY